VGVEEGELVAGGGEQLGEPGIGGADPAVAERAEEFAAHHADPERAGVRAKEARCGWRTRHRTGIRRQSPQISWERFPRTIEVLASVHRSALLASGSGSSCARRAKVPERPVTGDWKGQSMALVEETVARSLKNARARS